MKKPLTILFILICLLASCSMDGGNPDDTDNPGLDQPTNPDEPETPAGPEEPEQAPLSRPYISFIDFVNPGLSTAAVTMSTSESNAEIYYTTDGTDPTAETGTKYGEPILIQTEGEFEIRAIAVNANGIPSTVSSAVYTIEFPIVDAPAVTPATGQYTQPTKITITVPEGYTAYYTMDGSTPTSDSEKYSGPIDMPQDTQTIFSAVLINDNNGKSTDVTTRNYITRSE